MKEITKAKRAWQLMRITRRFIHTWHIVGALLIAAPVAARDVTLSAPQPTHAASDFHRVRGRRKKRFPKREAARPAIIEPLDPA